MKNLLFKIVILSAVALMFPVSQALAKLTMPVLFSDNMVLQQKTQAPVWGNCKPEKKVKVLTSWNNRTYETISDKSGNWMVKVETPEAGGPYKLTISAEEKRTFNNVLIGEVWLCSGQSNMEMPLAGWGKVQNYEAEIANASHPNIRLFQVEKATAVTPITSMKVMGNSWLVCSPTSVPEFSATAYFFAINLSKMLNNIPIGLIHTSWGGTPAEAWTSSSSLELMPDFADYLSELKKVPTDPVEQKKYMDRELELYNKQLQDKDRGYVAGKAIYIQDNFDDSNWKTMYVPKAWEEQMLKDFDGVVWFRKTVNIPASMAGKDLKLSLGTIDDNESTYFNGVVIGSTEGYNVDRNYTIPGKLVKAGRNIITIRVFDSGGGGGIYGDPNKMFISNGTENINLSGDWKYSIGFDMNEINKPKILPNQVQPTKLFNAMINPLIPYAIKGAIWYQGEANVDRAEQYQRLFPLMIHDWRKHWNMDFPFYYFQLANYLKREDKTTPSPWAELREAQQRTLAVANTGMAVSIDIGNGDDIHPKNKQEFGRRLALIAADKTYGKKLVSSGPQYQGYKIDGNKITVSFSSIGSGLKVSSGNKIKGFAVAGADKVFYWADAVIVDGKVVVSAPQVEFPIAVRYAWANNPECNLYNNEGLPAEPFRTDTWNN